MEKKAANIPEDEPIRNNHYVSEFHTKDWQIIGKKKIIYYNAENNEIEQKSATNLFAKKGINSVAVENWYNKSFESLNGMIFKKREKGYIFTENEVETIIKMVLAQACRSMVKNDLMKYQETLWSLMNLSQKEEQYIDGRIYSELDLLITENQVDIFFPESVFFISFYSKGDKFFQAFHFPINKNKILTIINKGNQDFYKNECFANPRSIWDASIGSSPQKILIPPALLGGDQMLLLDVIKNILRQNQLNNLLFKDKSINNPFFSIMGDIMSFTRKKEYLTFLDRMK